MKTITPAGITALLIPQKHNPVVTLQAWMKFGSADEHNEIAGLAHLFEHLLFKGTPRRGVGEVASEIESIGGDVNAYTTYDYTVMHLTVPADKCSHGLDILGDCISHTKIDPTELSREKEVVLEEIKRRNDMPAILAFDTYRTELYGKHPYGRPVIGFPEVVEGLSRDEIYKYYKEFYTKDNLFVLVCGDFNEEQVVKDIDQYFGDLPNGKPSFSRPTVQQKSHEEFKFIDTPTPDVIARLGWIAPNATHQDTAALDVLAFIMGHGESSRLYKNLVYDKKLVRYVGTSYWAAKNKGSFEMAFMGPKGTGAKTQQIINQSHQCFDQAITQAELEKAKNNILAQATYSKETVDGLAGRYGFFEVIGAGVEEDKLYYEKVRALNVSDINSVKDKYIEWDHGTLCGILPNGDKLPKNLSIHQKAPTKKPPKKLSKKPDENVQIFKWRNLKIIHNYSDHLPLFHMCWLGLGGKRLDKLPQHGMGALWARSVCSGGTLQSGRPIGREQMNLKLDNYAASLSAFYANNSFGFELEGLVEHFDELFPLAMACKNDPLFDAKEIQMEKQQMKSDIKSALDKSATICKQHFAHMLFGKHPYARNSLTTLKNLNSFNSAKLKRYHQAMMKNPQVLAISGPISKTHLVELLDSTHNEKWKAPAPKKSLLTKKKISFPKKFTKTHINKKDKEQTHIMLGYPSCGLESKDRIKLTALSAVLSGQGGRLFLELRDKMSLCYSVHPMEMTAIDGGYFAFYIATSPDKTKTAVEALQNEINKIIVEGVGNEEWERCKQFYIGNHLIAKQKLAGQNLSMALDELYGLGYKKGFDFDKRLSAVKASDIQKIAKKYFHKKPCVLSVVGPKQ